MQTFNDFERSQSLALKAKEEADLESVDCKKCGSQWFEEVTFWRFPKNHNLALGQNIPPRPGSVGYKFLRCGFCQNLIEPNVSRYGRDLAASDYDYLLDTLQGKFDQREKIKEAKRKAEREIQSEEL